MMKKQLAKAMARLSDARTRTFVIVFGAVIFFGIAFALIRSGSSKDPLAEQETTTIAVPSSIKAIPGQATSEQYRQLQAAENVRRAEQAFERRTSAIPTILGAVSDEQAGLDNQSQLDDVLGGIKKDQSLDPGAAQGAGFAGEGLFGKSERDKEREAREARLREQRERLEKLRQEQERQRELERQRRLAEQQAKQYKQEVQNLAKQMRNSANAAYKDWSKFPEQDYVEGKLANKPFKQPQREDVELITPAGTFEQEQTEDPKFANRRKNGQKNAKKKRMFVKAGTVLFGVLDTSVNTDEPSPVLATVVAGKFKGAKLIGSIEHQPRQEKVVINFETLSIPKYPQSVKVEVVAIDPDTARTAVASDVDHHYLLRYGTLFAASFMEGYAKAITNAGTTTVSPLTGTTTTQKEDLTGSEQVFAALGQVGKKWGQQVKPIFNRPYTVTINSGSGLGLLFLSDVDVTIEDDELIDNAANRRKKAANNDSGSTIENLEDNLTRLTNN